MFFKGKHLAAALSAIVFALAGCGGGDPQERYVPTRIVVFGDELSVIESGGSKHTINALNATTGAIDCVANMLWIQHVAHAFGMSFSQCLEPVGTPLPANAHIRATFGATIATMTTSVDDYVANGINSELPKRADLVLMLVGMHDVLELVNESPRRSEAAMLAEIENRGRLLAFQVNRLAQRAGGNPVVIVSTMPDLGVTPYAASLGAAEPGLPGLLTRLSAAFNSGLRVNMVQDGRVVGIVFADAETQESFRFPASRGYTVVNAPACANAPVAASAPTTPMTACTAPAGTFAGTLVSGATAINYLWADNLRPSPRFHELLGAQTVSRAVNNPF